MAVHGALTWPPIVLLVGTASVIACARLTFVGELLSHFRWSFGWVGLGVASYLFLFAARRRAALALALAAWGLYPEGRLFLGGPDDPPPGAEAFELVTANVLRPNVRHREVLEMCLDGDPDAIGLIEVSLAWRGAAIDALGATYPHVVEGMNTDGWSARSWGIMLFSKRPFLSTRVEPIECEGRRLRPSVEGTVDFGGEPLTIQVAHPERPGRAWRLRARRKLLGDLAAREVLGHRIVAGDLNTTTSSPVLADFLAETGLVDSRTGFGRFPTWQLSGWVPGPIPLKLPDRVALSVAIDHAFVDRGLVVLERETRAIPGSDHRAVALTVARRASQ